jgi:preprotein translocase subunit YajC
MSALFANFPLLQEAQPSGSGQLVTTIITFGLVFVIFYFLIIRPQNKKQKETKRMLSALKKGDKVVTIGGIRGTIQTLKEDSLILKVDSNTKLEFSRSAVSNVLEQKSSSSKQKKIKEEKAEEEDQNTEEDTADENASEDE